MSGWGLPGLKQYLAKQRIKCLAQGHNTVTPPAVRLEPASLTLHQLSHLAPNCTVGLAGNQKLIYCKSGKFHENSSFANSFKIHISDSKKSGLGHDLPLSVNDRVISAFC